MNDWRMAGWWGHALSSKEFLILLKTSKTPSVRCHDGVSNMSQPFRSFKSNRENKNTQTAKGKKNVKRKVQFKGQAQNSCWEQWVSRACRAVKMSTSKRKGEGLGEQSAFLEGGRQIGWSPGCMSTGITEGQGKPIGKHVGKVTML